MNVNINIECEEVAHIYSALLDAIIRIDRERELQGVNISTELIKNFVFEDSNCWGQMVVDITVDEG